MFIKTDRLIITEFDKSMTESVYLNSLDEDTRRFVPDEVFATIDEAKETVEKLIACYQNDTGPFVYPVILKDGKNIGYVQAVQTGNDWELGYHIAREHTGKGYATEAVTAFLPVIIKQLDISMIYGICHAENTASQKVLEKCGFILEYNGIDYYQGVETEIFRYRYNE
ncbi:GNAT family N-acetyltransferase [Alkalibacterium sp. f15]|uniref:GNAT family N-acetyltransferase n=1 Tax=Alkalibacterium sp. f15 TaxID=3414029 RepID=UPI003BF8801A